MKKRIKTAVIAAVFTAMASITAFADEGISNPSASDLAGLYGQREFQACISLDDAEDKGDHYDVRAMLCVPITWDSNPAEGKGAGDTIVFSISDLTGRTASYQKNEDLYEEDIEDMTFLYEPEEKDGKWRAVGPNDMELAKEIYNGSLKLRKDAEIQVFDYGQLTFGINGMEGYEKISADQLIREKESHERWGVTGNVDIPADEICDEVAFNPVSGKLEYTGKKMRPGAIFCPASYTVTLNENGEIEALERNYLP